MLQFYFLSILLNLITGLVLVFADGNKDHIDSATQDAGFVNNKNFRLVLGILTVFVGFIKILSVMPGGIPVIGDLFPALAGLIGGFAVLIEFYMFSSSIPVTLNGFIETVFLKGRRYIGIFCLITCVLHFLFPKVNLL